MEEMTAKSQMAKIRGFERGFVAMHLMQLGNKLGLFEAFNQQKEGWTVLELASRLNLHLPYLQTWCQTAYHLEILDCDEQERFRFQPFLDEILGDKNSVKNYLANIAAAVDLAGKGMEEVVPFFQSGKTVPFYQTTDHSRAGYDTTKNIYLAFLFMILPKNEAIQKSLEAGAQFLDIGCGDGSLIIQLAQSFPKSTFTGINPDEHGIKFAREKIAALGLEERVFVYPVSGQGLTTQEKYDLISLVVTLHEILPEVRTKVMTQVYQALKPGGRLLILDFPYPDKIEGFRNPVYDFGILDQFFEMFGGFVHLSNQEQNALLTEIGFKNINRMPIGKGMFDFITAEK
jgi:ubiquinone/menaquinone biosynthesis C-methylase UbiE